MGLGLAISRTIAEAHGGSLTLSGVQHGQFDLILPAEVGDE
jgi:signal transduction histidine kinase